MPPLRLIFALCCRHMRAMPRSDMPHFFLLLSMPPRRYAAADAAAAVLRCRLMLSRAQVYLPLSLIIIIAFSRRRLMPSYDERAFAAMP